MVDRGAAEQILAGAGDSDYERYIKTEALLGIQPEPEAWVHRDELLFTVTHQSAELWLKLAISEITEALALLEAGKLATARRLLRRVRMCIDFATNQLTMLEELTPWDYQHVRRALGHGSGFDSPGFRRMRALLPELRGAVEGLLAQHEISLEQLFLEVEEHEDLYQLVEQITDIDEALMMWRAKHLKVVERTIGADVVGTQGTPVQVIASLRDRSFFDDVWRVRSRLTALADERL